MDAFRIFDSQLRCVLAVQLLVALARNYRPSTLSDQVQGTGGQDCACRYTLDILCAMYCGYMLCDVSFNLLCIITYILK